MRWIVLTLQKRSPRLGDIEVPAQRCTVLKGQDSVAHSLRLHTEHLIKKLKL